MPVIGRLRFFFADGQPMRPTVFSEQLSAAVSGARCFAQINQISAAIWKAHGAGLLSDSDAQAAAESLQARKAFIGVSGRPPAKGPSTGPRKPVRPRSPDRQASLARRRAAALSGAVPSRLASAFTMGELAVLSVIAGEVKRHASCQLPIDAIAAMAGVCRTTAQNAFRQAARRGLIHVRERRRPGLKNLTNVVTIISTEWRGWLRLGVVGSNIQTPRKTNLIPSGESRRAVVDRNERGRSYRHNSTSSGYAGYDFRYSPSNN